jgi:hypothetical protein
VAREVVFKARKDESEGSSNPFAGVAERIRLARQLRGLLDHLTETVRQELQPEN